MRWTASSAGAWPPIPVRWRRARRNGKHCTARPSKKRCASGKAVSRPERNPMAESKQSEKFYLERFGVTDRELLAAMGRVKVRDVDYADLYFEHTVDESISMEESLVKRASKSVSQGVGVRATAGEKTC